MTRKSRDWGLYGFVTVGMICYGAGVAICLWDLIARNL